MRLDASEKHAVTFHVKHALSVTCVGDSETGSGRLAYSPPAALGAPPLAPPRPPPPPLLPPLPAGLSLLAAGVAASDPPSPLPPPPPLPHPPPCLVFPAGAAGAAVGAAGAPPLGVAPPPLSCPVKMRASGRTEECVTSCRVKSRARRVERAHARLGVRRVTPTRVRHKLPCHMLPCHWSKEHATSLRRTAPDTLV